MPSFLCNRIRHFCDMQIMSLPKALAFCPIPIEFGMYLQLDNKHLGMLEFLVSFCDVIGKLLKMIKNGLFQDKCLVLQMPVQKTSGRKVNLMCMESQQFWASNRRIYFSQSSFRRNWKQTKQKHFPFFILKIGCWFRNFSNSKNKTN